MLHMLLLAALLLPHFDLVYHDAERLHSILLPCHGTVFAGTSAAPCTRNIMVSLT